MLIYESCYLHVAVSNSVYTIFTLLLHCLSEQYTKEKSCSSLTASIGTFEQGHLNKCS